MRALRFRIFYLGSLGAGLVVIGLTAAWGAGQSSATYSVVADVTADGAPSVAHGSASAQLAVAVGQHSAPGEATGATRRIAAGYVATTEGFDSDYDGIPDNEDPDSDGDGVPDVSDGRPYDTDQDGLNNLVQDDDDDGDGLSDSEEAAWGSSWVSADTDGDRLTDFEEARVALTDPVDPQDVFKWAAVRRAGTNDIILWHAEMGVTNYFVRSNTQVTNPAVGWVVEAGPLAATGSLMEAWIANTSSTFRAYSVYIPY